MNINGTYKISIEMTARKQVEGLVATTNRLLGHVGGSFPTPPDTEEHIRGIVESFSENREVFDSFKMDISDSHIQITTPDGQLTYSVNGKNERSDGHIVLSLESAEMGQMEWDAVLVDGKYFLFESTDGLSEYAFERVA